MKRLMTVSTVLGLLVLAAAAGAEVFVYPKQGQGQDQFQRDQFDCHNWAQGQTGVNPSQPVYAAAPAPQTGGAQQRSPRSRRKRSRGPISDGTTRPTALAWVAADTR